MHGESALYFKVTLPWLTKVWPERDRAFRKKTVFSTFDQTNGKMNAKKRLHKSNSYLLIKGMII